MVRFSSADTRFSAELCRLAAIAHFGCSEKCRFVFKSQGVGDADVIQTVCDGESDMRQTSVPGLTLEDAMSVHVLRADGMIFSDLTRRFGANPARFHEILCGNLYPESWETAVERLLRNDPWHPEIAQLLDARGRDIVMANLIAANPAKRRFQKELKRLRKAAPPTAATIVTRGLASEPGAPRRIGQR